MLLKISLLEGIQYKGNPTVILMLPLSSKASALENCGTIPSILLKQYFDAA